MFNLDSEYGKWSTILLRSAHFSHENSSVKQRKTFCSFLPETKENIYYRRSANANKDKDYFGYFP